jgi:hypothetical protein
VSSGAVKPFGQFHERVVAAHLHLIEDGARALFDGGIEKAGRCDYFAQPLGEIPVGVLNHSHARRLGQARGEVKRSGSSVSIPVGTVEGEYSVRV